MFETFIQIKFLIHFLFLLLWSARANLYLYFLTFQVVEQSLLSNIDIVFLRDS